MKILAVALFWILLIGWLIYKFIYMYKQSKQENNSDGLIYKIKDKEDKNDEK